MSDLNYRLDFDQKLPPAVQSAIADGMQQAWDNADTFWKAVLRHCIWECARRHKDFTVDDVLEQLEKLNVERAAQALPPISTHNLSALGPAMRLAAKDGIIAPTLVHRRSLRPVKKGNLHMVWESKFYSSPEQRTSGTPESGQGAAGNLK